MARMIGLVVGQLVVSMMLTVGGASADVGMGSPSTAPSSGCPTAIFICETVADLVAPTALASADESEYCREFICERISDLTSPTALASVEKPTSDYCTEFICETIADLTDPAALASVPASPRIMLAEQPGSFPADG